ncbi:MAG: bile acid:sodium symporter family protein [Planctomycetaceae bacterium]|nr:bile acid:sodium symporter family protein [Planctomycetaceae bacterium]
MVQRYILLWLVLSSGIALFWPELNLPEDPFVAAGKPAINILIPVVMFCVGVLIPVDEVRQLSRRWPAVLIGTTAQYLSMPLFAWLMVQIFRPSPELATGILIVGCVPGAMASNVLTMIARGNVSYSVCLTTSATLLSPLVVPTMLWLTLGKDVKYEAGDAVKLLLLQVVLPVIAGHGLIRLLGTLPGTSTDATDRATENSGTETAVSSAGSLSGAARGIRWCLDQGAPLTANLAILAIIAIVVALNRHSFGSAGVTVLPALAIINIAGYLTGFGTGRVAGMTAGMQRALTLEIGMQNAGAGASIALNLFPGSSAAVPCVLYTFGCMLTGTLLAQYWSHQTRATLPEDNAVKDFMR